jgi:hypothetical protein
MLPVAAARPEIVGCAADHRPASSADDQQARPRSTGHFPRTLLSVKPAAGAPADCGGRLASRPRHLHCARRLQAGEAAHVGRGV